MSTSVTDLFTVRACSQRGDGSTAATGDSFVAQGTPALACGVQTLGLAARQVQPVSTELKDSTLIGHLVA